MTGTFYSVSTLLNQMIVTHYEVSIVLFLFFNFIFAEVIWFGFLCTPPYSFLHHTAVGVIGMFAL